MSIRVTGKRVDEGHKLETEKETIEMVVPYPYSVPTWYRNVPFLPYPYEVRIERQIIRRVKKLCWNVRRDKLSHT